MSENRGWLRPDDIESEGEGGAGNWDDHSEEGSMRSVATFFLDDGQNSPRTEFGDRSPPLTRVVTPSESRPPSPSGLQSTSGTGPAGSQVSKGGKGTTTKGTEGEPGPGSKKGPDDGSDHNKDEKK